MPRRSVRPTIGKRYDGRMLRTSRPWVRATFALLLLAGVGCVSAAEPVEPRPRVLTAGGGVGVWELMHVDASAWFGEHVMVDLRASNAVVAMSARGSLTLRLPNPRGTEATLVSAGAGRVWILGGAFGSHDTIAETTVHVSAGGQRVYSSRDFRLELGLMAALDRKLHCCAPLLNLTWQWRVR
jgi:hypothetical protein